MNDDIIKEIRDKYTSGAQSQAEIARHYGVSRAYINLIIKNKIKIDPNYTFTKVKKKLEDKIAIKEDEAYIWEGSSCHIWEGSLNKDGYAIELVDGKPILVHRHLFQKHNNISTENMHTLKNKCGHKNCVNILHWKSS